VAAWSLCSDNAGGFFTLGDEGVAQFDAKGVKGTEFPLVEHKRIIQGYGTDLKLTSAPEGSEQILSIANVDQLMIPVASGTLKAGLQAIEPENVRRQKGLQDGLTYQVKRFNAKDVRILGSDPDGKILVSIPLQCDGSPLGAVLFKGIDSRGGVYVELEKLVGQKANLEVHHYAADGKRLALFEMPNDYFTTVYKKTEVRGDGTIIQYLTKPDGACFIQYTEGQ